jgi:hypothetical protein
MICKLERWPHRRVLRLRLHVAYESYLMYHVFGCRPPLAVPQIHLSEKIMLVYPSKEWNGNIDMMCAQVSESPITQFHGVKNACPL